MFDKFNREIKYLRISVTDRCNLRCRYCADEKEHIHIPENKLLSNKEIIDIIKIASCFGINKIRLTGGEPLVKKDIVQLVHLISLIPEVEELSMTTNGILLSKYAVQLAHAGLNRINISLDTLDKNKYKYITGGGDLVQVMGGILAARDAGLSPIKINCVLYKGDGMSDANAVKAWAMKNGIQTRFINQMDLKKGEFSVVEDSTSGNCCVCNRIRITADGVFKPCLFSARGYDIRKLGIEKALFMAIKNKPKEGTINYKDQFYYLGG